MKKYKPLTYGFVTSPELSVHRKGKEGRLVNRKSVKLFNECMEAEKEVIEEGAKKYTTIETDPYKAVYYGFSRNNYRRCKRKHKRKYRNSRTKNNRRSIR